MRWTLLVEAGMLRVMMAGVTMMALCGPGWAKNCSGVVLKDSCNVGGECPEGPTWKKGQSYSFVGWEIDSGKRAYVVYREGSILADDVKLAPGCKLPRY